MYPYIQRALRKLRLRVMSDAMLKHVTVPAYIATIDKCAQDFDEQLGDFLNKLVERSTKEVGLLYSLG